MKKEESQVAGRRSLSRQVIAERADRWINRKGGYLRSVTRDLRLSTCDLRLATSD